MSDAARIIGHVDSATLEKIQRRKEEEQFILNEFLTLQNFYGYLRRTNQTREQWLYENFPYTVDHAVKDAFSELMKTLLPRGKLRVHAT
jgi:hypothetical protein